MSVQLFWVLSLFLLINYNDPILPNKGCKPYIKKKTRSSKLVNFNNIF